MQEIITYAIGAVVAIIIGRALYRTLTRTKQNECDCSSCEGCSKRNC